MSAPAPPGEAAQIFGERLALAADFADLLADAGVVRGLIGPREAPAVWERHVLNCAPLSHAVPVGTRVVDVGSGAGLPGLVLAIRRPDVSVDLVEPLARRCAFLAEAVEMLGLQAQVRIVRGRASDHEVRHAVGSAELVTARALAPLARLVQWCLPLVRAGGSLLAIKGARAQEEMDSAHGAIRSADGRLVGIESVRDGAVVMRLVRVDRRGTNRSAKGHSTQ